MIHPEVQLTGIQLILGVFELQYFSFRKNLTVFSLQTKNLNKEKDEMKV